jgi:DNA-binding beta-propeller fold protein YncE
MRRRLAAVTVVASTLLVAGCSGAAGAPSQDAATTTESPSVTSSSPASSAAPASTATALDLLPGMPAPLDPQDVWAADRPGALSPVVAGDRDLIYVPNSKSNTVTEIDPHTYRIVRTFRVGVEPQHVVPSWDLKTLWVNNDLGNSLTALNPRTGKRGRTVPVTDPYNLYFTPDGKHAVVMASAAHSLDFRDPHTMKLRHRTHVPCAGVNHADFSVDGRYFVVSCEFSSELLKVDTQTFTVTKVRRLMTRPRHAMPMPQDVKMSPDGRTFYIADMKSDGIWFVDGETLRVRRFLHTGKGAHGLYVTRDSKHLLITNREEGSISVLDFATNRLVDRWRIPGGGSPDMGGLSSNGKVFWVSGRYNSEVYAISTVDGHLIRRIPVGAGPHGLCVFPQPGRYSLGHTGVFR